MLPLEALQAIAFSSIRRRSDVAKAFGVTPTTVPRVRALVSHTIVLGDEMMLGLVMRTMPPVFFVSSFSGDSTTEQLNLPLLGITNEPELRISSV